MKKFLFILTLMVSVASWCDAQSIFDITEQTKEEAASAPTSKITSHRWVDGWSEPWSLNRTAIRHPKTYVFNANGTMSLTLYRQINLVQGFFYKCKTVLVRVTIKGNWKRAKNDELLITYTKWNFDIVAFADSKMSASEKKKWLPRSLSLDDLCIYDVYMNIPTSHKIQVLNDDVMVLQEYYINDYSGKESYYRDKIEVCSPKRAEIERAAVKKAEEEAPLRAQEEAKARAEAEAKAKAEAEAEAKAQAEAKARAEAEAKAEAERIEELSKTLYDRQNDVKIECKSNQDGSFVIFNDNEFSGNITKMYVNYKEVPVSNRIDMESRKKYVVIFKTNGIKEIKKGTFSSFDGDDERCIITAMHFPACLEKLKAKNGVGCPYCSDLYFYGAKAPKGPGFGGGFIFSGIDQSSNIGYRVNGKKTIHIMPGAKGFSGTRANISWYELEKCGWEFDTIQ